MRIRLFDPEGIRAADYKSVYPELGKAPEFESLSGAKLIFVWHFANKTSPLRRIVDDSKRVEEALDLSGWKLSAENRAQILKLNFGETLEKAIERMVSYEPGARYWGRETLKTIFERYNDIIEQGPDAFKKTTGQGDAKIEETDINAYVTVSSKIAIALPGLIDKMEEGFGISITGTEEEGDDSKSILRDWNINRQKS